MTVEVSDLQQQSGVCIASLAAPLDDRCLLPPLRGCHGILGFRLHGLKKAHVPRQSGAKCAADMASSAKAGL